MIQIAVLGYGTVGSGVEKILVHDYEQIVNDPDVKIVVEVMGGVEPAYTFTKRALEAGKCVCTSNKELVARHGQELMKLAAQKGVNYMFEASCGGGIPIIRPLNSSLTADEIDEISGILNGTTNYILTEMAEKYRDFDTVLKEAQELGYAERNPEADVEGYDACRKIAILSSLAYGSHVDYEKVYTEGITKITVEDMKYANAMGMSIKLLATSKRKDNRFYAMVGKDSPLYSVNGVFNGIFVHGNVLGDAMFYGSGAGKLPTASAVVADVVDCAKHLNKTVMMSWSSHGLDMVDVKDVQHRFFVRIKGNQETGLQEAEAVLGKGKLVLLPELEDEFGFITEKMSEGAFDEKASKLKNMVSRIRIKA